MPAITSINPESSEIPNNKLIDRKLIEGYCTTNKITVHQLLLDIVQRGSNDLSDFIVTNGGQEISNKAAGVLHGSTTLVEEFEPRVSRGGGNQNKEEPLVYATDDPDYAIFMGIIKLRSGRASVGYYGGQIKCSVNLDFVNGPSEISDGYVYILDRDLFVEDSKHHMTSPNAQEPLMGIPIKPIDLKSEIHIDTVRE